MPEVTFLVHLNMQDASAIGMSSVAEDIAHDLEAAGHDVLSVAPWMRPTLSQSAGLAPGESLPGFQAPDTLGPPPLTSL